VSEGAPGEILDHLRTVVRRIDDQVLPAHYPTCLGCGPDAAQGFHLQVRREGDEVVAEHVFENRHSGAPGIAHGGAVATVVDDVLGFLLYVVRAPGVTRKLEVEYLKPVLIGRRYTVRARVDEHDGRKIWVSCECTDADGTLAFRGKGLFLEVGLTHFAQGTSGGGQDPVAP
jgi:acyl-coenzyme A thioesterase PaaI-like protein